MLCVIHISDSGLQKHVGNHGIGPNLFFVQDPESSGQGKQALRSLAPRQKFGLVACWKENKKLENGKFNQLNLFLFQLRGSNLFFSHSERSLEPGCYATKY